jgi:type VI secretion system secreted protein VgrG
MTQTAKTQAHRTLGIATPLGLDKLLLVAMHGTETLGRLFEFELELASEGAPVDYTKILGQNVTVRLALRGGGSRYFNGFISRFAFVGVDESQKDHRRIHFYRATMVPWTWYLTRTADCRIFQDKTVPQIIEQIFRDKGFTDFSKELQGSYRTWEYCVQYRETDFNFISRLMENEGIYYYFKHENGKHTIVLCDSSSNHSPAEGYKDLHFDEPDLHSTHDAYIWDWVIAHEITPNQYAINDFDPLQPRAELFRSLNVEHPHDPGTFEIYDYPGGYVAPADGRSYVTVRMQEVEAPYAVAQGESSARGVFAGATFTLQDHPSMDSGKYLITGISYQLQNEDLGPGFPRTSARGAYHCQVTCIPAAYEFRTPRTTPKPFVQGPQTALVVGPSGEEIYTDRHGRVKVKFHWDRDPAKNETSSCWIRVAQNWGGKQWGIVFNPRIGQEVIVDFLEGDPDRPIITGRVYNGDHVPPYALPANQTVSTIKSDSSPGHGGFNELRFEDKKGSEQVFINAQRRMDERVGASLYETIGANRETHTIKDRNLLVDGDQNVHIKGSRYDKIDAEYYQHVVSSVIKGYDDIYYLNVALDLEMTAENIFFEASNQYQLGAADMFVTAGNAFDLKAAQVHLQGTQSVDMKTAQMKLSGDSMFDLKGGAVNIEGSTVSIKGNMAVNIEGSTSVSLKCGGNAVVVDPSGVSIQGTLVKVNMGAAAGAASSAAAAGTPQEAAHIPAEDMTDPLDAYDATSALPGSGGGWGGPSRTHTTYPMTPHPYPPPPPPPSTPSQPSGSSGGPGTQDSEVELVELVEVVQRSSGDVTQSPNARKQYVNMAAATDKPEFTRKIRLKARIRWRSGDPSRSLAGKSVKWYLRPGGSNRGSLTPQSLKAGFDSDGGAERKDTATDADGWTPIVEFHSSQYGGDEFTVGATLDPGYSGGLTAGAYTVWRRIFYEVDCMTRVDGGTFSNLVNEGGVRAEYAKHFVEIVKVGQDSSPAYRRVLMDRGSEVSTFSTSIRNQSMAPRYFHLIFVDTVAVPPDGSPNKSLTVDLRRPGVSNDNKIPLPFQSYCILADDWFRSCTWTQGSNSGTIDQSKCRLVERSAYAVASTQADGSDGDGWDVEVDLSGIGDTATAVRVTLNFKSQESLSGLNTGIETIVSCRFRERRYGRGSANAIASTQRTSTHEPGHAMGMLATKLPDGTNHPNLDTAHTAGTHCTFNTDQCCMFWTASNVVTFFCRNCSDALRGRKLESIPLDGADGYT